MWVLGFGTQVLIFVRQALYQVSRLHPGGVYFLNGTSGDVFLSAGVTGMYHLWDLGILAQHHKYQSKWLYVTADTQQMQL